ncbi:hypothetical protein NMY22_g5453 [Coprinellus aureogranulatus]|nr:hypothetical protein NMY22_g5453 [Coprinellus aureogranulatus]
MNVNVAVSPPGSAVLSLWRNPHFGQVLNSQKNSLISYRLVDGRYQWTQRDAPGSPVYLLQFSVDALSKRFMCSLTRPQGPDCVLSFVRGPLSLILEPGTAIPAQVISSALFRSEQNGGKTAHIEEVLQHHSRPSQGVPMSAFCIRCGINTPPMYGPENKPMSRSMSIVKRRCEKQKRLYFPGR